MDTAAQGVTTCTGAGTEPPCKRSHPEVGRIPGKGRDQTQSAPSQHPAASTLPWPPSTLRGAAPPRAPTAAPCRGRSGACRSPSPGLSLNTGIFQQGEHGPFQVSGSVDQRGPRIGLGGRSSGGGEPWGPQKCLHRSNSTAKLQEPNEQQQLEN